MIHRLRATRLDAIEGHLLETIYHLWVGSFSNSRDINDINFSFDFLSKDTLISDLLKCYGQLPYAVYLNGNPIGFFFDDFDSRSNAIGLSVYIPYFSAKTSSANLKYIIFIGIMHNYYRAVSEKIDYLELNTFSKNILKFIKKYIPNVKHTTIRDEYILVYEKISNLNLSIVSKIWDEHTFISNSLNIFNDIPMEKIL